MTEEPAHEPRLSSPPPPAPPRPRRNAFAQWLTHWTFWPAYAAAVFVLLAFFQPWRVWLRKAEAEFERSHAPNAPWVGRLKVHSKQTVADSPAAQALPVGSVIAVVGDGPIGMGWLPCDGRKLTEKEAPELARAFAGEDGKPPSDFTLPDYRGLARNRADGDLEALVLERDARKTEVDTTAGRIAQPLKFWIRVRE